MIFEVENLLMMLPDLAEVAAAMRSLPDVFFSDATSDLTCKGTTATLLSILFATWFFLCTKAFFVNGFTPFLVKAVVVVGLCVLCLAWEGTDGFGGGSGGGGGVDCPINGTESFAGDVDERENDKEERDGVEEGEGGRGEGGCFFKDGEEGDSNKAFVREDVVCE